MGELKILLRSSPCLLSSLAGLQPLLSTSIFTLQLFGCSVSDSLWPHWLQHTRLPCPSPSPGMCSNSRPLSHWCHLTISSFVIPISSCLQSSPASESFLMSQLFTSGGQILVLQLHHQSFQWIFSLISFRTDYFNLLAVQGTLKSLLQHHGEKASILWHSTFFMVQFSHLYLTTGKIIALTRWTFVGKVMSLLFNTRSGSVITFLPRSKCLLISWLQSWSAVILEPKKIKSVNVAIVSPSVCHEVMWLDAMILVFWMLKFNTLQSLWQRRFCGWALPVPAFRGTTVSQVLEQLR